MAKAKPITGLDPHAPTGENARIIARTRLEEMYSTIYVLQPSGCVTRLRCLKTSCQMLASRLLKS